jgi:ABC-type Fe3+-siderophore transport system permease subunit
VKALLLVTLAVFLVALTPLVGGGLDSEHAGLILWQLRVPRMLMGVLVGGTLSVVGAAYQLVFGNPLATPSTVGTTAGAVLGALAALVLGVPSLTGIPVVALAAFAGALTASLIVSSLAASGRAHLHDVLLAGIAISLAAGALSAGLQYTADMGARFAAIQWSLGHLPQVGYRGIAVILPFVVVTWAVLLGSIRGLRTLTGGEALARTQGVDVARLRVLVLGGGALGVAATVAWCGPIAFVGLVVPHLVRLLLGHSPRVLLPASIVFGATFLVLCDLLARVVLPGREVPVGVITAALGAPALLALLIHRTDRSG